MALSALEFRIVDDVGRVQQNIHVSRNKSAM